MCLPNILTMIEHNREKIDGAVFKFNMFRVPNLTFGGVWTLRVWTFRMYVHTVQTMGTIGNTLVSTFWKDQPKLGEN